MRRNIAGIGIGGMGRANLSNLLGENIIALCDVDHAYAVDTFREHPRAQNPTKVIGPSTRRETAGTGSRAEAGPDMSSTAG